MPVYARTSTVTVSNTMLAAALLSPAGFKGNRQFPADSLKQGDVIIVRVWGRLSSKATGAGTLQLTLLFPDTGTVIADTGAINLPDNMNAAEWEYYHILTVRSAGQAGTLFTHGYFLATGDITIAFDDAKGPTAINTTAANSMEMTAKFGIQDPNNTLTCNIASIEQLTGL
jgi:hypothetical protein